MNPVYLLTAPLAASIISLLAGKNRLFQQGLSFAILLITLGFLYVAQQSGLEKHAVQFSWIESLGIFFAIGYTKINFWFLILTSIVVFIAQLAHLSREEHPRADVMALIFALQVCLFGVFMAQDLMLFYFCFEASILPIYFISSRYGSPAAVRATLKFFLYTLFGSLFMLLAILYMKSRSPEGNFLFTSFQPHFFSFEAQQYLFLAFFIAFAIKMPLFPFHSWQADVYCESPVESTILMSGILLKMGIYGMLILVVPMFPMGMKSLGHIFIALSAFGVVFGAIIAMVQYDIRRVLAFSSLSHVGLIGAGLLAWSDVALEGVVLQMFAHGINISGLFFLSESIVRQTGTRDLDQMGGLNQKSYALTILFFIFLLGSIAVPLTNGFPGEFQLLMGLFRYNPWLGIFAGLTVIFSSVYMLRLFSKAMLGMAQNDIQTPGPVLKWNDTLGLTALATLVFIFGLFPGWISGITKTALQTLLFSY